MVYHTFDPLETLKAIVRFRYDTMFWLLDIFLLIFLVHDPH